MTEADRARLIEKWFATHTHEWDAYNQLPLAEREANEKKICAALHSSGPLAGRAMARALGLPGPPDELCDPVEVLEARLFESEGWIRDKITHHNLSHANEVEGLWRLQPRGRVDH